MGRGVVGLGWSGLDGVVLVWPGQVWVGMGWDGMGWGGVGWDRMGWDGMGWGLSTTTSHFASSPHPIRISSYYPPPHRPTTQVAALAVRQLNLQLGLLGLDNACASHVSGPSHELFCNSPPLRMPFHPLRLPPVGGQQTPDPKSDPWAARIDSLGLAPSATLRVRSLT